MSTRQVAGLLAAAAPEVVPPRDTLRAVAPNRYTLKVTIDQECEQGLRRLKGLRSHLDPRMSWGDLVARLVRDAVAWHDPRGGGNGHRRRRSAGSAGASPSRAPSKTRAAGAVPGPAPQCRARRSLLRRRSRHLACPLTADRAAQQPEQRPAPRRMAPIPAPQCRSRRSPLRRRSRHLAWPLAADRAAQQPEQRAALRRMAPMSALACRARRSPLRRRSRHSACPLTADRAAQQPEQRSTRPASAAATNPRHGATFPRRSGATFWQRDGGRCCYRDPLTGRRCTSFPSAADRPPAAGRPGGWPGAVPTSSWPAQPTTECATATDRLRRRSRRCSASAALLPRRSTALADGLQVARRDTHFASRPCGRPRAASSCAPAT